MIEDRVGFFPAAYAQQVGAGDSVFRCSRTFIGCKEQGQITLKEGQVGTFLCKSYLNIYCIYLYIWFDTWFGLRFWCDTRSALRLWADTYKKVHSSVSEQLLPVPPCRPWLVLETEQCYNTHQAIRDITHVSPTCG